MTVATTRATPAKVAVRVLHKCFTLFCANRVGMIGMYGYGWVRFLKRNLNAAGVAKLNLKTPASPGGEGAA